ncbi:hypothetical protein AWJ20_3060 [Sugiyamaella lignohabitans]|uniref:Uncharacterized protein n=1 Tax=Sugiyamaella lignohabitans TaxID=796027 RepID=A0A167FKZ8_9ASCO|nr:uncharacterized protein AWJ20_3060 [Sugiyamaella lignohabitans]ANB15433.1 hypothetical protein AWJ20_3060 [Sugiyamaella lignohabitans]
MLSFEITSSPMISSKINGAKDGPILGDAVDSHGSESIPSPAPSIVTSAAQSPVIHPSTDSNEEAEGGCSSNISDSKADDGTVTKLAPISTATGKTLSHSVNITTPTEQRPSDPFNPTPSPPRRTSGRVRVTPQFYVGEPLPPPKKRKKKKTTGGASKKAKTTEIISSIDENGELVIVNGDGNPTTSGKTLPASMIPGKAKSKAKSKGKEKSDSKDDTKGEKKSKPLLKISIKSRKKVPPPSFIPIENNFPLPMIWEKLVIREFVLRFDKLCRMPTRHATSINDPNLQWNEYLYKSLIVSILKVIANDTVPVISNVKAYLGEVEKTSAESEKLWHILEELVLGYNEPGFDNDSEFQHKYGTELAVELWRLQLVRKLVVQATCTETIRLTIQHDQDELRRIQLDTIEEVKNLRASWEEQALKLTNAELQLSEADKARWKEKYLTAKQNNTNKIRKAEQNCYFLHMKYNQRTAPLGIDNIGNTYWHFQQKSNASAWGSWIIIEPNPKYETPLGDPNEKKKKTKSKKKRKEGEEDEEEKKVNDIQDGSSMPISGSSLSDTVKTEHFAASEAPETPANPIIKLDEEQATGNTANVNLSPLQTGASQEVKEKNEQIQDHLVESKPQQRLFYISGKQAISELVEWIQAQWGVVNSNLIKELDAYANKCDE